VAGDKITLDGITSAYQTNISFNQITDQTNIVYFSGGTLFPAINNTNFVWNSSVGAYTNRTQGVDYFLFYNATWNSYLIQSNTATYGSGANFVLGDIGVAGTQDITLIMGSGYWANFAQDAFDETLTLSGNITNAATNTLLIAQVPMKMNLTTNLQTPLFMVDSSGRVLAKFIYASNANHSFIAPYTYSETNQNAQIATNLFNENQGGAQVYIDNQASSSIDPSEQRFGGGVVTFFGWGGAFGSAREYFGKWATGWPRPPWQSSGTLSFPFKATPIGGLILGYNSFDRHTMLELGSNGVVTIAPSWTDRPQFYLMPSPAPTNTPFTGQMWNQTNSTRTNVVLVQRGLAAEAILTAKTTLIETNPICPTPVPYGAIIWNSNKSPYWLTTTATNPFTLSPEFGGLNMSTGTVTVATSASTNIFAAWSYSIASGGVGIETNANIVLTNAGVWDISVGTYIGGADGETMKLMLFTNGVNCGLTGMGFTATANASSETGFKDVILSLPAMTKLSVRFSNTGGSTSVQNACLKAHKF